MRKIKCKNTKSSRKELETENPYLKLDDFDQQECNTRDWKKRARSVWMGECLERR